MYCTTLVSRNTRTFRVHIANGKRKNTKTTESCNLNKAFNVSTLFRSRKQ